MSEIDYFSKTTKCFSKHGLELSRMVCGSKSTYRRIYPNHEIYFNANVFTDKEKVWYGDIDLFFDAPNLQNVANELNKTLYVLSEMDGRFENEESPIKRTKKVARDVFIPQDKNLEDETTTKSTN